MLGVGNGAGMPPVDTFGKGPPVILFRAAIPWLTDAPSILVALAVAAKLAQLRPLLGVVSIAGGAFVLYLAWDSFRPARPGAEAPAERPRSWLKGILINRRCWTDGLLKRMEYRVKLARLLTERCDMKTDGRRLDHKTLETLRKLAVRRVVEDGQKPSAVIASLGLCRTSIYRWLQKFYHGGWETLSERIAAGPRPKLTEQQCQQVKQWIVENDPCQYGLGLRLWTRRLIAKLIKKKLGVRLGVTAVGRLLAHLGITPQKPLLRAYERDEEAIRDWMENTFPKLLERARKRHATMVCIDESGFMLAPLVRRTWAPRGCTPVVKIAEPHNRISVIGAISISPERRHFRFHFHLLEDNVNFRGISLVRFIKDVHSKIRGPITILWDEIPIHYSKPVMDHLGKHQTIVVETLPLYAPELNAVDYVWSYVKWGRFPNYAPPDLTELRRRLTAEFRRLEKRPDLLKAFFARAALPIDPVKSSSDSAQPSTLPCNRFAVSRW